MTDVRVECAHAAHQNVSLELVMTGAIDVQIHNSCELDDEGKVRYRVKPAE